MRWRWLILVLTAWVAGLPWVQAQINPTDLPPSPFTLPIATEPQSAYYLRDATRALELYANHTNPAVQNALGEIRVMKNQIASQEKTAWQNDPLLQTCDQYIDKAHDWVMQNHGTELAASTKFFYSTNDPATVESRRRLASDVNRIWGLVLFHELNRNTNFAPLQTSLYEFVEQSQRQNTNGTNNRWDICTYWWFDRYIGFPDTNRPTADCSFTNLQAQIGRRYDLLVAGLAKIQREKTIPAEAMVGLKYGLIYRTVDGLCEIYLEVRTPPELQKLRENLRRKLVDLSWLVK